MCGQVENRNGYCIVVKQVLNMDRHLRFFLRFTNIIKYLMKIFNYIYSDPWKVLRVCAKDFI